MGAVILRIGLLVVVDTIRIRRGYSLSRPPSILCLGGTFGKDEKRFQQGSDYL